LYTKDIDFFIPAKYIFLRAQFKALSVDAILKKGLTAGAVRP